LWYNCFNRTIQDLQHQSDQKTAQLAALREIGRAINAAWDLQATLELITRKVVERAKGVLMRREGLSEKEAYLRIQRQAVKERGTKRQVAEAILRQARN